jgi:aminoglycoside phosphotransferase (APT) family kinase protein
VTAGIDVPALTRWFAEHLPEFERPLEATRIGGGQSNLTFRIDDADRRMVILRRPPLGTLLPSAHDVVRECRVLTGLASVGARVPQTLGVCETDDVLGAPFYAMEHVDGLIVADVETAERLSADARSCVGRELAAALTELQAVDLRSAGLGELERPESLAGRQLRRWARQWQASKTRDLPEIEEVGERLAERLPAEPEAVLVHGDFRLDNAVLGEDGTLRAVLDWELCTSGDPLADVGLLAMYWSEAGVEAGGEGALFAEPVTALSGFPSTAEVVRAYAEASGRDLDALDYWVAFAYWKIAIVVEGVYRRWLDEPLNALSSGAALLVVERLARRAGEALDRGTGWA